MMSRLFFVVLVCLTASSCGSPGINYNNMTDEEIAVYNQTVPLMDSVVCTESGNTSSRLKRRRCRTVEETMRGDGDVADITTVHVNN
jgi:hypothetical protein